MSDPIGDDATLTAADGPSRAGEIAAPTRLAPIGRFVILELLGEGGMGVVYAAYDPTLDRRIAVKLVRARVDSASARADQARLLREARALARVAHPGILTIHDAGVVGDQVFIATELAGGGTLRAWRDAAPRTWREIVAAYVEAGRGLAAAHDAGLVHRDFKPDNVLRTTDGRIRVADFGLVGGDGAVADDARADLPAHQTSTGAIVGTPRYMAPEQHRGATVGPAADQFAFCVALWEALASPPFPGAHRAAIAARIEAGPPEGGAVLPPRIAAILARGLAIDPAARWSSMHALVDALADDPDARRRRRWRLGLVAAMGAGLIAAVIALATRGGAEVSCDGGAAAIASVWSPAQADALRAGFARTGAPYAGAIADRAIAALDARAASWAVASKGACVATRVTGEQSEAQLDRRTACLARRKSELGALARALVAPDRDLVDHAIQAIAVLPAIEVCADTARLAELTPPPADPATRTEVERLFARIDQAVPAGAMAMRPDAVTASYAALAALAPEVAAVRHPPLAAALALHQAEVAPPGAQERHLTEALRAAAAGHDDAAAADAWAELVLAIGVEQHRHGEAALVQAAAEAASARAGRGGDADPELLENLSDVANDAGDFAGARDLAARALAAAERAMGEENPRFGRFVTHLATAERFAGHYEPALALQRRALAIHTRVLGPDHPATIYDQALIVTLLGFLGRGEEALAVAQANATRAPQVLGGDHPYTGAAMFVLAQTQSDVGRHADALAGLEAALPVFVRANGAAHVETLNLRGQIASELTSLERYGEAIAAYRTLLPELQAAVGAEHPRVAQELLDLGVALMFDKQYDEARKVLARSLAMFEKTLGADHVMLLGPLVARGQVELTAGRTAAALPWIDRSIAFADKTLGPTHPRALNAHWNRALALWDLGRRDDARTLARELVERFRAAGAAGVEYVAVGERWLAEHP
ncbi:MAG: tetratricopeptide repeat protein [Deltaproteobacteria bacterium]|nr:tetratricopeptide repeat protein [Deltaproteobacteria bacterium]